ncbi:Lrp/AsnC family transcriptional regulator [Hyperthermus butylicus]|uniref:HTH-type transcriptional regulator n=1 Tax=Hyperthermus butylicus (strain DSM 5456 / JCM 9403 / PLM1-5) TaxID=415426 RepID=A2BJ14_HYPBU|nr:Lrp/AsnC family transcriptional regulator [Hyperthermus butylicus]ABM79975.1 HTH-type transcriptional regulator [Hyperthermus butylicus DSM 5456]
MSARSHASIDDVDYKLVKLLAMNARQSIRELARELKLAASTVHTRLSKLVKAGVIRRFTVLPDYDVLGYTVTVLILMQVEGGRIVEVGEYLAKSPNVIAVYDITGDYDLAVVAKFRSVSELDKFIKAVNKLPAVKRTVTSLALRAIKEDPASPLTAEA